MLTPAVLTSLDVISPTGFNLWKKCENEKNDHSPKISKCHVVRSVLLQDLLSNISSN